MLRNILERSINGKRESHHFKLLFCRKSLVFSLEGTQELRPKSRSREQRIEKVLDM